MSSQRSRTTRCPICGKPADPRQVPFCSPRCKTIDLGRWLNGVYRVPTEEPAPDGLPEAEDDRG